MRNAGWRRRERKTKKALRTFLWRRVYFKKTKGEPWIDTEALRWESLNRQLKAYHASWNSPTTACEFHELKRALKLPGQ